MPSITSKKQTSAILFVIIAMLQSFLLKTSGENERAHNLKVIYPEISHKELMITMNDISRSLGVNCNYCHITLKQKNSYNETDYDFASDSNSHKIVAREMMRITAAINTEYFARISHDNKQEQITCVTCHMGRIKPVVSIDFLQQH